MNSFSEMKSKGTVSMYTSLLKFFLPLILNILLKKSFITSVELKKTHKPKRTKYQGLKKAAIKKKVCTLTSLFSSMDCGSRGVQHL